MAPSSSSALPTDDQLRDALARYSTALTLRANSSKSSVSLTDLDKWYRNDLRDLIAQRRKEDKSAGGAWISQEELGKLMQWKLAVRFSSFFVFIRANMRLHKQHGTFRPRLLALALSNSDARVRSTIHSASLLLPTSPLQALNKLCELTGVGPATASAILATLDPANEPFLSDEAFEGVLGSKPEYTVKGWTRFRDAIQQRRKEGGWKTVEELEKALWSWGIEQRFGGEGKKDEVKKAVKERVEKKRKAEAVPEDEIVPEASTSRPCRSTAKKFKS